MLDLVPLDRLPIPTDLSGARGRNRAAVGRVQIAAEEDHSAVLAWLARYADSAATLTSYRKEAEQRLLWCVLQCGAVGSHA